MKFSDLIRDMWRVPLPPHPHQQNDVKPDARPVARPEVAKNAALSA